ncbi:Acetyltransferase (GNAT) domain-containing protein [Kosakonia arachidis]|uniref:Acetyltransferase (GNAT) domain-containing protein n=1 Tax=Kosakonia arachidis TaxID=551989 RepID=A0A1I6ZNU5_9ENTR|nr:GNAT family N-acetyltransferase [Kosakonia arachidis]SFT64383.1 Acetyltransferase (GNAT) domain-containing protein [Kosakonia arachidis]
MTTYHIHASTSETFSVHIDSLCEVLENCVSGGASVSFMHPLSREKSRQFWSDVAASVARGERIVLVAQDEQGEIVGTVQMVLDQPENQPHRADVAKLLVHEKARRQGLANRLMAALEHAARENGKTVLVLDTSTGSGAEHFYQQSGWQRAGEIPRYALMPDGNVTGTTIFYKFI